MASVNVERAAAQAADLMDALIGQEFGRQDCMALVVAAMPAIVAANTEGLDAERRAENGAGVYEQKLEWP